MFSRTYRAALLAAVMASMFASPASAACRSYEDSWGSTGAGGLIDVGVRRREGCTNPPNGEGGDSSYPRYFWRTQDIFWGSTAGCPEGMVDGIRRYFVVTAPDAEPLFAYDAPACVPVPAVGEDGAVDGADIEAILRGVLPQPEVARDPYADGLVGLETYFWYAGETLTEVDHDGDPATPPRHGWSGTTSRNGITITATLWVERFAWQVEPGREVSAASPGAPDDPAATHTYARDDTYDLVASTTWAGSYSRVIDLPAGAEPDAAASLSGAGTLNGVTLSSPAVPFRVREIRAVPADA